MALFGRKKRVKEPVIQEVKIEEAPPPPVIDDSEEEVAAIIAAISAMGGAEPSKIVVRSIVRVAERFTNWNRLILTQEDF